MKRAHVTLTEAFLLVSEDLSTTSGQLIASTAACTGVLALGRRRGRL